MLDPKILDEEKSLTEFGILSHKIQKKVYNLLNNPKYLCFNISDQNIRNYRSSKLTRILQPYIESGRINLFVTTNH